MTPASNLERNVQMIQVESQMLRVSPTPQRSTGYSQAKPKHSMDTVPRDLVGNQNRKDLLRSEEKT